ncbi:MAG: hypothetical protein A2428_00570 [Bdellovibrionales bacterium RIFOXYC1_FULL_54_43]|nr:MAG: hypothetical protein A2428_00570 [Bdellovibrionales bacterium RIFOXYC1_FULL_54_43]OFZ82481.1 MAG: hypothetical protein A2603_15545 [Bdellovibrionales bacterium RIFOXYD1_FULL_55_31]
MVSFFQKLKTSLQNIMAKQGFERALSGSVCQDHSGNPIRILPIEFQKDVHPHAVAEQNRFFNFEFIQDCF